MCTSGVFCLLHHHLSIPHCLGGDGREDLLEVLLHGDHWRCHYRGDVTRWEAFSLFPCKGLGVLQRCFPGKWMNVLQAVPGILFIAEKSMFWGVSETESSRAGTGVKICLKGISPKAVVYCFSSCNQCLEMVCMAQGAQQLPVGIPQLLSGSLGFGKGGSKRWDEHSRHIPVVLCNIWRFR